MYEGAPTYLVHHGVEGQSWGKRHGPPYPLERKKFNLREAAHDWAVKRKKAKAQAKRKRTLKEKKRAEEKQQNQEAKKKKLYDSLMNSRSDETNIAEKALKNKQLFTTDELKQILDRARTERDLRDVQESEIRRGAERLNRLSTAIGNMIAIYNAGAGVYNMYQDQKDLNAKGDPRRALIKKGG